MTGPWKAWKSKTGFPTLSTAPWKSRTRREIPTFPQPGFAALGKWKTKPRFPTFPPPLAMTTVMPHDKPKTQKGCRPLRGLRMLSFQDHLALETECCFRIILGLENAPTGARVSLGHRSGRAAPLLSRCHESRWARRRRDLQIRFRSSGSRPPGECRGVVRGSASPVLS